MTTRTRGFTLIELLVVVAIIGIIASIGFVSYSGYVSSAKKKTASNAMMQLSLAQTEFYSENSYYWGKGAGTTCTPSKSTSNDAEAALVGGTELFTDDLGYNVCIVTNATKKYYIVSEEDGGGCKITMDGNQIFTRQNC